MLQTIPQHPKGNFSVSHIQIVPVSFGLPTFHVILSFVYTSSAGLRHAIVSSPIPFYFSLN